MQTQVSDNLFKAVFPKYTALLQEDAFHQNSSLETFLREELPRKVQLVRNMESSFNAFLTHFGNIILKRPQLSNLVHILALKATDKVEKYFQTLLASVRQMDAMQAQSYLGELNLQQLRIKFREKLSGLQDLLQTKYFSGGVQRASEQQICKKLYVLLEFYHLLKSDPISVANKFKFKQQDVLTSINRNQFPTDLGRLLTLDTNFGLGLEDVVQKRYKPFLNKRDMLALKVKQVLREGQSKVGTNIALLVDSIIGKQRTRVSRQVSTALIRQIKEIQGNIWQTEARQIISSVQPLKRQFSELKNTNYFIQLMRGNFAQTYKMQIRSLENIFYLSNLQKYLQDVATFLEKVLKLQQRILQNNRDFMSSVGMYVDSKIHQIISQYVAKNNNHHFTFTEIMEQQFYNLHVALNTAQGNFQGNQIQSYQPNQRQTWQQARRQRIQQRDAQQRQRQQNQRIKAEERKRQEQVRLQKAKQEYQQRQRQRRYQKQKKQQERAQQLARNREQKMKKDEESRKSREQQLKKRQIEAAKRFEEEQKRKLQRQQQAKKKNQQRQRFAKQQEQAKKKRQQQVIDRRKAQDEQRAKRLEERKKQDQRLKKQRQQKATEYRKAEQERIRVQKQKREKQMKQAQQRKREEEKNRKEKQQKQRQQRNRQAQKKQEQRLRIQKQKQQKDKKDAEERQQKENERRQKEAQQKRKQQQRKKEEKQRKQREQAEKKQKLEQQKKLKQQQQKQRKQQEEKDRKAQQQRLKDEKQKRQKQQKQKQERQRRQKEQRQKKAKQQKEKQQQERKQRQESIKKAKQQKEKEQKEKRQKQQRDKKEKIQRERKQKEQRQKKQKQQKEKQQRQRKQKLEKQKKQKQQRDRKQAQRLEKERKEKAEKQRLQKEKQERQKKQAEEKKLKAEQQRKDKQLKQKQEKQKKQKEAAASKNKKPQPKKSSGIDYGEFDDLDEDFDQIQKKQNNQNSAEYNDDFQDESPSKQQGDIETKELISSADVKCLNDYMKGTTYARKNKPNAELVNKPDLYTTLFDQLIQNRKLFIFEGALSKAVQDLGAQLANPNTSEDDLRMSVDTIKQEIQAAYQQLLPEQQVSPTTRFVFPFPYKNAFGIRLLQVIPAHCYFRAVIDAPLPEDQQLQGNYQGIVEALLHTFELQGQPQFEQLVINQQSQLVLWTFDKDLPCLLLLFALHYEPPSKQSIVINQYTIQRLFYIANIIEPLYKAFEDNKQIEQFFQKLSEKYENNDKIKIFNIQVSSADPQYNQKLTESSVMIKQQFQKSKNTNMLTCFSVEITDENEEIVDKVAVYMALQKASPKPTASYFIVSKDNQEQQNASLIFELISQGDENFESLVYTQFSRHYCLSNYSDWSLPLWAHIHTKRKLSILQSMRAMAFAMTPYYLAFKELD